MTESPYMTTAEVAEFARCATRTVERAWAAYRHSAGREGLRATQRGAFSTLLFHRDDVDRWVKGEQPVAPAKSRLRRAS